MIMMKLKNILMGLLLGSALLLPCEGLEAASLKADTQIGFGQIIVPESIADDEFIVKALYFTMKQEAKRLKNVVINYNGDARKADDFIINVSVGSYDLNSTWVDPSATTSTSEVWHQERKWYDDKKNEHTMHIRRYATKISDCPGYFSFKANVTASVFLQDPVTGDVIVRHDASRSRNKEIDAYTDIMKDFYKKVNKALKAE